MMRFLTGGEKDPKEEWGDKISSAMMAMEDLGVSPAPNFKVLIVDDDDKFLSVVAKDGRASGILVLTANNAIDACKVLDSMGGEIDLLVVDYVMPGKDGRKVLKHCLSLSEDCRPKRVVWLTGYMCKIKDPVDVPVFEKPMSFEELIGNVNGMGKQLV